MSTSFTPDILVTDVARASKFLTEALAFKELERMGPDGAPVWAMLAREGNRVMLETLKSPDPDTKALVERAGGRPGATVHFYLSVDDVAAEAARLRAAAVKYEGPVDKPYGMRELSLTDADGYSWMIGQRIAPKP